ncbi:polyamine oxidase 5-like isoform X2 [Juglans regia]|uniref:Polyamine oxidase 5-like isoform X2 n=1 Tax=Juglans regia TaxID=51240 RepID=A0A6P9EPZ7_JUGRE|nr:polyamine oxidase 5-like isoform X2 [Juglans regia]
MAEASAQCLQEEHEENPYSISIAVNLHHWLICTFASHIKRQQGSKASVIIIGNGISGVAAAHILNDASFKVILLESKDIFGSRIHTDYSFRCLVEMGASCLILLFFIIKIKSLYKS